MKEGKREAFHLGAKERCLQGKGIIIEKGGHLEEKNFSNKLIHMLENRSTEIKRNYSKNTEVEKCMIITLDKKEKYTEVLNARKQEWLQNC